MSISYSNTKSDSKTPTFSREQYEYLNKLFAASPVVPGMDHDTILYNAGCRAVVDKIATLVGTPNRVQIT